MPPREGRRSALKTAYLVGGDHGGGGVMLAELEHHQVAVKTVGRRPADDAGRTLFDIDGVRLALFQRRVDFGMHAHLVVGLNELKALFGATRLAVWNGGFDKRHWQLLGRDNSHWLTYPAVFLSSIVCIHQRILSLVLTTVIVKLKLFLLISGCCVFWTSRHPSLRGGRRGELWGL